MADGGWRAFSLGDGEKEPTNESTRKTVFDGPCDGRGGHEREGTGPTTGRRQAAGCIARHDGWKRAYARTSDGANAAGGRFAAWVAARSIRSGSRHASSGAARR